MRFRSTLGAVLALSLTLSVADTAVAAATVRSGERLSTVAPMAPTSGWFVDNGTWYYAENGQLRSGWLKVNDVWYYLNPAGAMQKGWVKVNGAWYFLDSTGAMATGWRHSGGAWYYLYPSSGAMASGWLLIDKTWYYLDPATGAMKTGWIVLDTGRYFLDRTGIMKTGWVAQGSSWYFLGSNGVARTGWVQDGEARYYLDATGIMQTGWQTIGGVRYYFGGNGALATGWRDIAGARYYFGADGTPTTGWVSADSQWYYLDANGAMQTGWIKDSMWWFYLRSDGSMATNWAYIDGFWYLFSSTGAMQTGWNAVGNTWYYLNANGTMQKGWLQLGKEWYFLNSTGAMVTGLVTIDGHMNIFSASGLWVDDDANPFPAGNIIADGVMFNPWTMNDASVQAFLNDKNPSCTAGPGNVPCLKNYRETPQTMSYLYCGKYEGGSEETAAQIIAKSAALCGVNPQVLLTMLQKEQGLVTASGASLTSTKYQKAMGALCPDFSECDPSAGGFSRQVYKAASLLRTYTEKPNSYRYRVGATVDIQYHPNASCGSSPVYLENKATAALYNYTPYQPNRAAMDASPGEGDACSTYGNRNFLRTFTMWFGPAQ